MNSIASNSCGRGDPFIWLSHESYLSHYLPLSLFLTGWKFLLQVSTICESKSDDKRFSIFTGTKRLHLRAETREDRVAWLEALQAVKDMFPRMSNVELMAPLDNGTISTDKLRHRLLEEGVNEAAIQDSEQIMRNEFAALQSQLVLLKQKQWVLIDTLRQLEVMKTRKLHANQTGCSCSIPTASQDCGHA